MKLSFHWSKTRIILLVFIGLLIIGRLMLPYFVKKYVNKVLSELDGYKGHVEDIDIWLIRGAYVINELNIEKIEKGNKIPVPFVYAESIDLSVDWRALFKGGIKAKVTFIDPVLNFVAGPEKSSSQTGAETDWTEPLDKLLPIEINRLELHNGKITYSDFHSHPKVDIFINKLFLSATNLSNLEHGGDALPSDLFIDGSSIGGGHLLLTGKMNVLKEIPDADINMKFTDIKLTALNDFANAYGKFDFEKGKMSLFSEMSLKDAHVTGYVKPLLEDIRVLNWSEEQESVLQKLWEGAIGTTMKVLKNQPKDRFATKIPIEGDVNKKIEPNIFKTLVHILHNAFIEAYKKSLDDSVAFGKNADEADNKKTFKLFK